jgi:hypothetical protein
MLRRAALSLGLVLCGCGGVVSVRVEIAHPAAVPARAFPSVWIATGAHPIETELGEAIAGSLRSSDRAVRQVLIDELEPARRAQRIPSPTLVVLLETEFDEGTRTRWSSRPETVCGPSGCYTADRSYTYEVPEVTGHLRVTVYDGPSARVLERLDVRASDSGRDFDELRERVVTRLRTDLLELFDERVEVQEVELLPVGVASVDRALETIENGDWREGRRMLERARRSGEVERLSPEDRAKLYYDLGQTRRFDPRAAREPERYFRAAEQALRRAIALDDDDRYEEALRDLARQRRRESVRRAQREAAARNFDLARTPDVPPPPPSYER